MVSRTGWAGLGPAAWLPPGHLPAAREHGTPLRASSSKEESGDGHHQVRPRVALEAGVGRLPVAAPCSHTWGSGARVGFPVSHAWLPRDPSEFRLQGPFPGSHIQLPTGHPSPAGPPLHLHPMWAPCGLSCCRLGGPTHRGRKQPPLLAHCSSIRQEALGSQLGSPSGAPSLEPRGLLSE